MCIRDRNTRRPVQLFQHWLGCVPRMAYSANIFPLAFIQKITNNLTKYDRRIHKDIAIDAIYYRPKLLQAYCTTNVLSRLRHFGTSLIVPKCLGSEVSWVRSVLTPLIAVLVSNIGLPILELRFNLGSYKMRKCESAKVNMYKMRKGDNAKVVRKCV